MTLAECNRKMEELTAESNRLSVEQEAIHQKRKAIARELSKLAATRKVLAMPQDEIDAIVQAMDQSVAPPGITSGEGVGTPGGTT